MKQVLGYLSPYKGRVFVGLLVKSFATIMELFLPYILAYVIDEVVPLGDYGRVIWFGIIMLVSAVLAYIGNIVANRMAARVSSWAIEALRNDSYEKIMYFTNRKVDELTIPSLISRMTSDTYHVYRMFNVVQRIGIRAPIILLGSIGMMLFIDAYLAMVLVLLLPVITLVVVFISKKGIPFYDSLQQKLDILVRVVRENIAGIRIIKALAKESSEKEKFELINEEVSKKERLAGYVVSTLNPSMNLLLNLGLIIILYIGAQRVQVNLSSTGSIIAFMSYFTLILNSFLALNRIFLLISRANASALRIVDILNTQDHIEISHTEKVEISPFIEFKDVSFSYNQNESHQLQNLNFKIEKNSIFGIIGSTGSGKTTIAQLLLRFYDVSSGTILIDGKDIKSYQLKDLRSKFGVVLQNDRLFSSSVEENIKFGRDVEFESIQEAADLAQAKGFIEQLSKQYDERVLRGGANFSGGQRQRMLIARALADRPEILIFDDASSALDYRTDAQFRTSLRKTRLSTTILIAQRISTVMSADQILVLEEGRMVGLGTHDQLSKNNRLYQELIKLQLGGDVHERSNG
ncbi:MAG TPA: ABC transporter ATP-binding protein [Erysipelotrichaceae bacterium]|nr:ABC transporter ATP-binding protein [Erysipelotrichaceae bacterium]